MVVHFDASLETTIPKFDKLGAVDAHLMLAREILRGTAKSYCSDWLPPPTHFVTSFPSIVCCAAAHVVLERALTTVTLPVFRKIV